MQIVDTIGCISTAPDYSAAISYCGYESSIFLNPCREKCHPIVYKENAVHGVQCRPSLVWLGVFRGLFRCSGGFAGVGFGVVRCDPDAGYFSGIIIGYDSFSLCAAESCEGSGDASLLRNRD